MVHHFDRDRAIERLLSKRQMLAIRDDGWRVTIFDAARWTIPAEGSQWLTLKPAPRSATE